MESFSRKEACMSAVLPFLCTKRLRRAINANQHDAASTTRHETMAASRAHYLSAAFTSA
jgi:hypothetical protein